jgi:dihydroxy-acid dehydratase
VPRADQDVIRTIDKALYKPRPPRDPQGQPRTEGCVAKITGLKNPVITGPARVYDSEELAMAAIMADKINHGDVLVIRYEGPKGGPGMREMLTPTSALIGKGFGETVGLITDGRFLRRHLGHGRRPRGPGSLRRRPDRPGPGRRLDHD